MKKLKIMSYQKTRAEFMLPKSSYGSCATTYETIERRAYIRRTVVDCVEALSYAVVCALIFGCVISLYVGWDAVILS